MAVVLGMLANAQVPIRADDPAEVAPLVRSKGVPSLRVADGYEIDLVIAEPIIEKPLYMQFDARGRLWVAEYRQYPWPAGLKLLSRDNVWRNVYDQVPPPPPHAADSRFRGADRVSIHEDFDRDGTFESHKLFIDGLSLATAALPMAGGVYVLNPPYLLFYADANGDDQPDSLTPRILLSGFGIEDSHSIANSLRRGVDGWIYGTQGSTVSAAIVRHGADNQPLPNEKPVHSLGQNLWRYHPVRHVYEIVAEGGGNAFGVEIDGEGNLFSGHNGGDTRGFHYTHGGYYRKTFDKHGDLSHPFAFGALPAMAHHRAERFSHTFLKYEADTLGADSVGRELRGDILAVSPIRHEVMRSAIERLGSTFRTRDLGLFVSPEPGDRPDWFSPVDIQQGPDGCVYIADWYSEQCNHYRNHEGKTTPGFGRVYRVRRADAVPPPLPDLSKWSREQLATTGLESNDRAIRRLALGELVDRLTERPGDAEAAAEQRGLSRAATVGALQQQIENDGSSGTLEIYGALQSLGAIDDTLLRGALTHRHSALTRAVLQTLADRETVPEPLQDDVLVLAAIDQPASVRLELAAAARRWPKEFGLRVAAALVESPSGQPDSPLSAQLWWLVEHHTQDAADLDRLLTAPHFVDATAWNLSDITIDPRADASLPGLLVRRCILRHGDADVSLAERLLTEMPVDALSSSRLGDLFVSPTGAAFLARLQSATRKHLAELQPGLDLFLRLGTGDTRAVAEAVELVANDKGPLPARVAVAQTLSAARPRLDEHQRKRLWTLATATPSEELGVAVLGVLRESAATATGEAPALAGLAHLELSTGARRDALLRWLAQRPETAKGLVEKLAELTTRPNAKWSTAEIPPEVVAQLRAQKDEALVAAVDRLFPASTATAEQRERRIEQLAGLLSTGGGQPLAGKELYHGKAACGRCHAMFGQGGKVGPDLTSYDRRNIKNMLLAVVHPSAEIREGYLGMAIETVEGRLITGLKVAETSTGITLRGSDGTDTTVASGDIETATPLKQSLMPENLLDVLSEQDLRNLFAFLAATTPPK